MWKGEKEPFTAESLMNKLNTDTGQDLTKKSIHSCFFPMSVRAGRSTIIRCLYMHIKMFIRTSHEYAVSGHASHKNRNRMSHYMPLESKVPWLRQISKEGIWRDSDNRDLANVVKYRNQSKENPVRDIAYKHCVCKLTKPQNICSPRLTFSIRAV